MRALLAAALFGISAPLAKVLLGRVDAVLLAGLLYLGSGVGAGLSVALRAALNPRRSGGARGEAGLRRGDLPWILGATLCGGVAAPILILLGLRTTPASVGSLLLNFEGVATALIAAVVFRESLGRRVWTAVVLLAAAGILLSWDVSATGAKVPLGTVLIVLGCVLWGADNNLTRVVSGRDPLLLVAAKGTIAGLVSLTIASLGRVAWPPAQWIPVALLLGFLCYGLSIALFVSSLRDLGAARTAALFGTAPFLGAIVSLLFLREPLAPPFGGAFALMAAGAWLLLVERHGHGHAHESMEHDHRHRHGDGHHDHTHPQGEIPPGGRHAHPHRHEDRMHAHPHTPDLHHRHPHPRQPSA